MLILIVLQEQRQVFQSIDDFEVNKMNITPLIKHITYVRIV